MRLLILLIGSWEGDDFIQKIGLVANTKKEDVFKIVKQVIDWLQERNVSYYLEGESARALGRKGENYSYSDLEKRVDFVIVFGGDGTFLHTAQYFFGSDVPLLGVNMGRLGFLTEIEINELEKALEHLVAGNYQIEKRMTLKARVFRKGKEIYNNRALNDFVVSRGEKTRTVRIEMSINDEVINSYRADGLIIATPTGSTAYSLSAGGPIVNPKIRAIIATPICPHTLYVRPMVISDHEKLKIKLSSKDMMKVTADGNCDCPLYSDDEILITASDKEVSIIKLPERTFYTILHKKMMVGLV